MMMTSKKGIKAEDLYNLSSVADPRISPDESKIAFVKTTISKEKNEYVSNIFIYDTSVKEVFQWTFGENRNHSPRWSPDGTKLAFVSNRSGKNQIFLLSAIGGEAKQLTNVKSGAQNPIWSPDGKKIAFSVSMKKDESLQREQSDEKDQKKKELEPLEVTKMKYKSDGAGFFTGQYQQIAVVDVQTDEMDLITEGEVHYSLIGWSNDGKSILFGADFSEDTDFSFSQNIFILNIETKERTQISSGNGSFYSATMSKDGSKIAIIGSDRKYENATLSKIFVYDVPSGELQCLSNNWDIPVGDFVAGDFQQGAVSPGLQWAKDDSGLYFIASENGNTNLYFTDLDGNLKKLTVEKAHIYGLTISQTGRAFATISYTNQPSDLYEVDLNSRKVTRLTQVNDQFLQDIELSKPEEIQFTSEKGWTVHGWLMKPVGFKEGEKYPLILEVHGGPHAMYANTYFHEFQMLASSGFAVLYTNPRGSHGYGQEFVDAVRGDYGGGDYKDLMNAVDYVLENFNFIDESRLGVTGGSYGGFMTNWIIGHTNRFRAAVTQRSISNWISFYGVSDIGYYFNEWQHKLDVNDFNGLWNISPIAYVEQMNTPLLILHSEKDYRCPIEQAEQLFIALKHRKKEAKFIRFPESNHELSRSGIPNLRIKRLEYIQEWFKQYL